MGRALKRQCPCRAKQKCGNLATECHCESVSVEPLGDVDYRVIVDISRFDTQLGKSVNLEASWAIMEEKNHKIVSNGQAKIEQRLNDASYNSAAQALSKLLSEFSQQLSLALVQVPQK